MADRSSCPISLTTLAAALVVVLLLAAAPVPGGVGVAAAAGGPITCCWDTHHGCNGCEGGHTADTYCGVSPSRCDECGGFSCGIGGGGGGGGGRAPPPSLPSSPPPPAGGDDRGGWVTGTYTTRYWDCCKPSCSWPGKGTLRTPVRSCRGDGSTAGANERSVCDAGGTAGACTDAAPWQVSATLSYGFAAAAVSGASGLTGDAACGQCYALRFSTGNTHVVQVTNIGYDVNGEHSFDLQVPGGGRGIFADGCTALHGRGTDADCGRRYGGCDTEAACERLAPFFRTGCRWRFGWLADAGRAGNPRVSFRRVRCPAELVAKSGAKASDDSRQRSLSTI